MRAADAGSLFAISPIEACDHARLLPQWQEIKKKHMFENVFVSFEMSQAMLNRLVTAKREANAAARGAREIRPYLTSECKSIYEAERFRNQVIREITKCVNRIQDASMGEHAVRDLNDKINKLFKQKYHWEKRSNAPKVTDSDGTIAMGDNGYWYFGAARNLPGVRELFEKKAAGHVTKARAELYKAVDADYFGYRDDDDGLLAKVEAEAEKKAMAEAVAKWRSEHASQVAAAGDDAHSALNLNESGELFRAHVPLPSADDIQKALLEKRKRTLMLKYGMAVDEEATPQPTASTTAPQETAVAPS